MLDVCAWEAARVGVMRKLLTARWEPRPFPVPAILLPTCCFDVLVRALSLTFFSRMAMMIFKSSPQTAPHKPTQNGTNTCMKATCT